jgi:hypothetical protein
MSTVRALVALGVAVLIAVGCAAPEPARRSAGERPLGPGEEWLPLANWMLPDGGRLLCTGGGTIGDFEAHGSPDDPRIAWMTWPDGHRSELAFDPGWSARFVPGLELIDPSGSVAARDGTRISGICATAEPGVSRVEFDSSP